MKQGNQLLASMFLGYPHCYPEMGEWICRFINLMQGEHLGLKISGLNCFLRAVQCCLARSGSYLLTQKLLAQGRVASFVTTFWQAPHLIYYIPVTIVLLLLVLAVGYLM